MDYADLEIGLYRWEADHYAVDLRYSEPNRDADVRPRQSAPTVSFDPVRLRALLPDPQGYGQLLGDTLFSETNVRTAFAQACAVAREKNLPLRVRLYISPNAPELHNLRWETLRNPIDQSWLVTSEQTLFSRYLISPDFRPLRQRDEKQQLQALVAIANPSDLTSYKPGGRALAPVDVAGELARARAGLNELTVTELASGKSATLNNLVDRLRKGCDVLYLVCHGALVRDEPLLWLEDDAGNVDVVAGSELVTRLQELQQQPRLVVMASCQSAGTGVEPRSTDEGALAALGPRLAEAGIPAVVGMQGNITMATVAAFMPVFFHELLRDGQIDRAMAAARGAVRQRPDCWMPVLFMRLKSGSLWLPTGLDSPGRPRFEKWDALLGNIAHGRCTPILGPGLLEPLMGPSREIARRWAETYHFPMAPQNRDDLPQVAQFLAQSQDRPFPRDELEIYLRREIRRRFGNDLTAVGRGVTLGDLVVAAGAVLRQRNPQDAHAVLAGLPCPVYITTNADSLLTRALADAGKRPQVGVFSWQGEAASPPPAPPAPETPLVYHLFGHLKDTESLVLTEDDYFDYLINVTSKRDLIPLEVRRVMTKSALLFLGFQMDDWNFRVLFRSIMAQEGSSMLENYAHIAVQIDPEGGRFIEPDLARRYLERYFRSAGASISIYWGKAEDFLKELQQRWTARVSEDSWLQNVPAKPAAPPTGMA